MRLMKKAEKSDLRWFLLLGITSVLAGIYFELYHEARFYFLKGMRICFLANTCSLGALCRTTLFAGISFIVLCLLYRFRSVFRYVHKYRYFIGFLIIVIWTVLSLSGSSIAVWHSYLGHEFTDTDSLTNTGVWFGIPRSVRSDEWSVFTPFNFSQKYNGFGAITHIIRGAATDVTTTYGGPSFAVVTLFRPFLWGYFFLGNARGLAFFWIARTVFLFLASYEFGRLIAKDNKCIAALYAGMLTFSQTIQWWYAVNGLIEMFLFGQFAIVLLDKLVHVEKKPAKLLICVGLIECAGGFAFTYYPAQEIPLAYFFGITFLWNAITNRKLIKKTDTVMVIVSAVIFAVMAASILWFSKDTFQVIMNTAYPGKRLDLGGYGDIRWMFHWILSPFSPIDEGRITAMANASELATFYALFPVGILWAVSRFLRKRFDFYTVLLVFLDVFFTFFYIIGFPEMLSKITMMSNVTCNRLVVIIMFINVVLLIRCMATRETKPEEAAVTENARVRISGETREMKPDEDGGKETLTIRRRYLSVRNVCCALLIFGVCALAFHETHDGMKILTGGAVWGSAIVMVLVFLGYVFFSKEEGLKKASVFLLVMITISGMMVNPLQHGADVIYEDELTKMIESVVKEDADAVWLVTPGGFIAELPIMVGAPTINCINVYPNMDLWQKFDKEGKDSFTYNRYAQIQADLTEKETSFELLVADAFAIHLNYKDLKKIGADYILTSEKYDYSNLEYVKGANGFYIYHVTG